MKKIVTIILLQVISSLISSAQIKYLGFMKKEPEDFLIKSAFCNKIIKAPVVDGKLNDEVWGNAPELTGFEIIGKPGEMAIHQTRAYAVHDGRYLYIAFECMEPEMDKVRTETFRYNNRDILFDDRIEILLDVSHNHKNVIRLVVNSNGVTFDTRLERPVQYSVSYIRGDDRWNTEWRAKIQKYADRWTGEVAIAIDRIYDKEITPGTTWGFNLVRDRHAELTYGSRNIKVEGTREISAWKQVRCNVKGEISDQWIEPNQYGDLIFDQAQIQVTNLSFNEAYANYNGSIWHKPQFFGDNPLEITLRNNGKSYVPVKAIVNTVNYGGAEISTRKDVVSKAGNEVVISTLIPIRAEERQTFTFRLINKNTGQLLYQTSYDTRVPPFVEFDLSAVYNANNSSQEFIKACPVVVPGILKDIRLEMELYNNNSLDIIAKDILNGLKEYQFQDCFKDLKVADLKTGTYTIKNKLVNADENIIGSFDHRFSLNNLESGTGLIAKDTVYSFGGQEGKAIVVNFPEGEKYVFWEHANYIPWWDLNNMAVTYEFMECWGYGNQGCSEPMQDKENRYSKAEIIENSPARVVILWRYALGDPNYRIFFNEWVNEYYYLYPDGSGVREIQFWPNSDVKHEILQPQYIFPTGVIPEQMFEDTTCTVFNLKGEMTVNLLNKPVFEQPEFAKSWNEEIMRIYLKGRKHPYLIWSKREDIVPNSVNNGLIKGDVRRSMGGHWPMQPMNVDVYSVVGTNKPYHSWLGSVHVYPDPDKQPNRWIHLIGITNQSNSHLITIGKNWLYPAKINLIGKGIHFEGFDTTQKAYIFKNKNTLKPVLTFSFSGVEDNIIHPVCIVKNISQKVKSIRLGNTDLDEADFKSGAINNGNEKQLIIWMNKEINPGIPICIQFEQ